MVQPQYNPQEALERVKLMMKYDTSKTLNENRDIIFEQESTSTEEKIAELFYDDGASGPGTNPDKMFEAIKQINNKDLFWKVNNLVRIKSGMDIAGVINDEYGIRNAQDVKNITDHLKSIGVNATYELSSSNSMKPNSFKITTTPKPDESEPSQSPYSKFPCVEKHSKAVKGKDVGGNDIYTINGVVYYGNGRKRLSNGTMANYTCNDPEFKGKSKPVEIPETLKDAEGVMRFQDWLDNNAAGWATGYKDGIIKKGENGGGYGKFGPRTQKAWNNPTYKDGYLKSLQTPTESTPIEDTDSVEIEDKDPNKL
jgi:hypothetical protein